MAEGDSLVSIRERLLKERNALLDLSTRNRLLNTPLRTRNNRAIEIVDERSAETFRLLSAGKAMSFKPGVELADEERSELDPEDDVTGGIPQPAEDEGVDERGVASRHADLRLQTRLTSEGLQKRLFDVWDDAQTFEQEQGVNILYLAIGLLRWFDGDGSDIARHAPLVLLPVKLERTSAADRFKLRWRDEPPSPNLTLQAKMKAEFGLSIEDFTDEDELDLSAYCARVAEAVAGKARWEVLPDAMVLGFFSFAKFLMYRDLDPENWPQASRIDSREMIAALLRDGFAHSEPLVPDDAAIDEVISPLDLNHVVDADSSQAVVIAEAAAGRSLVVKGPPGTGKSQTITNIIAAAVARGRKVLFVAEKMAALEVVHRRLQQVGLGPLVLELHSNKANKRLILEELRRTRDAQLRAPRADASVIQKLGEVRDELNAFADRLHRPLEPSGLTPHAILGLLSRGQAAPFPQDYALDGAERWTRDEVTARRRLVEEVAERAAALGPIDRHPWRGVGREHLDPAERRTLESSIAEASKVLAQARQQAAVATEILRTAHPVTLGDLKVSAAAAAVADLPNGVDLTALLDPAWRDFEAVGGLLDAGRNLIMAAGAIDGRVNATGLNADYTSIRAVIVTKGRGLFRFLDGAYRAHVALFRSYLTGDAPKSAAARVALIDQIIAAQAAERRFNEVRTASSAFGQAWRGLQSDWDQLAAIFAWRQNHRGLPQEAWSALSDPDVVRKADEARQALAGAHGRLIPLVQELFGELAIDLTRAFGVGGAEALPLESLADRLDAWLADMEGASQFMSFAARPRQLEARGAVSLVDALYAGRLQAGELKAAFDWAYAEVLRQALFHDWPELRGFDGELRHRVVETFRRLDRARIELAREQIVAAHAAGRPHGSAGLGPLGVLNAELAKKRRHLPIRVLLDQAGPAIQQLKPVFMMSPLSVAQFLKPGGRNSTFW